MRTPSLAAALALAVPIALQAQAAPTAPVDLTGRSVTLQSRAGPVIQGELLAARADSAWVLSPESRRVVGVRLRDFSEARVRRHGMTARTGLLWGLVVGAISGIGMTAACAQVEDTSCGGVFPIFLLGGLLYGGVSAISFSSSSRWRFEPVTAAALAPFARFPQGPPAANLDSLLRGRTDTLKARRSAADSALIRQ